MILNTEDNYPTTHISPSQLYIQYFGRWDKTDANSYRCAQGAVYIKLSFTGTSIKVRMLDKENYWKVSIDNGPFRKFRPAIGTTALAENLSPGVHKLLLVRMTEGIQGISCLLGFIIDGNASLVRPEPPNKLRIEFLGDSITAGAKNAPAPNNPKATIICIEPVPDWVGADVRYWICLSINQLKAQGEKNIHYISLNVPKPLLQEADYANDLTHPTADGAKKIALYLKDKVTEIMKWQ